jgi:hypothetical protein
MAAFNHTPFGWLSWGLNWLTHAILFDHTGYATHSTTVADWGIRGGGMRAFAGYGSGRGVARPRDGYAGNGFAGGGDRGYRQPMEAYNRAPAPISRTQAYSRPESRLAYGPEVYNGAGRGFAGREQASAAMQGYGRSEFAGRSSGGYGSFQAPKQEKSGGFHLFGGGSHEPKMSASNSFGGGRGFSEKAPKMPKMSGGGKSFGGGHSSGGHSGGGHSSSHGGGHHR